MNLPAKAHFPRLICCVLIMMVLLACKFLTGPALNPAPATPITQKTAVETPAIADQSTSGIEATAEPDPGIEATVEPDPLDHLLGMRSITIHLTAQRPDGSSSSTQIEIDNAGSMHVITSVPPISLENLPQTTAPPQLATSVEVLVVGGKAYQPGDQNANWMSTPFDEDYLTTLSANLHGPDGPDLWLDMLPDGSLTSAGKETVGGFDAEKYTVNGTVEGQAIIGSLWYEPQAAALIKAELTVPAALYDMMDKSATGQVKISLDTQKADVPLVTCPAHQLRPPSLPPHPEPGPGRSCRKP